MNEVESIIDDALGVTDKASEYFLLPQRKITQELGKQIHGDEYNDLVQKEYDSLSEFTEELADKTGVDNIANDKVIEWLVQEPAESGIIVSTGVDPETGEPKKPDTSDVFEVTATSIPFVGSSPAKLVGYFTATNLGANVFDDFIPDQNKNDRRDKLAIVIIVFIILFLVYES